MKNRTLNLRVPIAAVGLIGLALGCSSSHGTSADAPDASAQNADAAAPPPGAGHDAAGADAAAPASDSGSTGSTPDGTTGIDASEGDTDVSTDTGLGSANVGPDSGPTTGPYTIGVTVTGLGAGATVVLQDNGGDALTVSANGASTFATPVPAGSPYSVTIETQPSSGMCTVSGGIGLVGSANVSNIVVNCASNAYLIGGTITGLSGSAVLQDNGGDNLSVTSNGFFAFATPLAPGAAYNVSVLTQPGGAVTQTCTVAMGTGTVASANISSVSISCVSATFTVGGTVTGLAAGNTLTLEDNGSDNLAISANGTFTFAQPVSSGGSYFATVLSQPTGTAQTCTVSMGSGTMASADITSIAVSCSNASSTIGGTLTGLAAGDTITLQDNGGDPLTLSANGPFTFPTALTSGGAYAVTVSTQPAGPAQQCSVSAATGTANGGNVTNVVVNCAADTHTVGGTVTGLAFNSQVKLSNNGGDTIFVTSNGSFAFDAPVASGAAYAVTVAGNPQSPVAQTCTVSSGTGSMGAADVTSVAVACTTSSFAVGGTVSGLVPGSAGVTLTDNGGSPITISANGPFTFGAPVSSGAAYTVVAQNPAYPPASQTCAITNGSGAVGNAAVTGVTVTCATQGFSVGGTVSFATALSPNASITLQFSDQSVVGGGDAGAPQSLTLTPSSAGFPGYAFASPAGAPSGSSYTVTIASQPNRQSCSFAGGGLTATGTVPGTSVTSLSITCVELNGGVCTAAAQCQSSNCEGDICCNAVCNTTPQSSCGQTGTCSAAGTGCAFWASGSACLAAACSDGPSSSSQTTASTCDGAGTCNPGTTTSCGAYKCGGAICKSACSASSDCTSGNACVSGSCVAQSGAGSTCSGNSQCSSGACGATGSGTHCCATACSAGGTCGAIDCDSNGACILASAGLVCAPASCSNGMLTPAETCDGMGSCTPQTATACPGSLGCASATACKTGCTANSDCTSGTICELSDGGGTCVSPAAGTACTSDSQCASGYCTPTLGGGSVCSTTACYDQGSASCGTTGKTNASGTACLLYAAATSCGAPSCSSNTQTAASTCDGAGNCVAGAQTTCGASCSGTVYTPSAGCSGSSCGTGTPIDCSLTGKVCDAVAGCIGCETASDCPAPANACVTATCTSHTCGTANVAASTLLPPSLQIAGDCQTAECDGTGNISYVFAVNDTPAVVMDSCVSAWTCTAPDVAVATDLPTGSHCIGFGTVCGDTTNPAIAGVCVECNTNADCDSGHCTNNSCE